MVKFLVTNELNDINKVYITHFSLDKGHHMAKSFAKLGHDVYFLTGIDDYIKDGIKYISLKNLTNDFVNGLDYIIISREATVPILLDRIPAFKTLITIPAGKRHTKFIIKSDCPIWFHDKEMRRYFHKVFGPSMTTSKVTKWVVEHIDYICAQNEDFLNIALRNTVPRKTLLISNMGVPNEYFDYNKITNPYTINHDYCVTEYAKLSINKALIPRYYISNPDKRIEFDKKKFIIIYTGRIKVNGGKILFNMVNIMEKLGDDYELHIFPGSFLLPSEDGKAIAHSARNGNSLGLLRDTVFKNSKNIIVHYPYEHQDKHRYLHFADCGIDFSDVRPKNCTSIAGHAKILEYCEIGLPIVCEENINNLFLVRNGKNGIILPYLASDDNYVDAIRQITSMKIDREYCRKVTIDSENWDKKAQELLEQLNKLE